MSIKIAAILGSLRKDSYTKKVLLNAETIAKQQYNADIIIFDNIGQLPFVNEDYEKDYYSNDEHVIRFKKLITDSDGIIFATPEYNFSVSGVLKNAIDIATRPYGSNALVGKPFGILSQSPGVAGGIRAQVALRQSLFAFGGLTTGWPEFALGQSHEAFDSEGKLNEQSYKLLETYLAGFFKLVQQHVQPATTKNTASDVTAAKQQ